MTKGRLPPIDEAQLGDTNLFGFMVTVNFPRESLRWTDGKTRRLEDEVPSSIRLFQSTLSHECVHFIHALMTSYLYRTAVRMWEEVQAMMQQVRRLSARERIRLPLSIGDGLAGITADLDRKSNALQNKAVEGICARDVIESAAVFIATRMNLVDMHHEGYMMRLQETFGSSTSPYCNAYRLGDWFLGEELFEVFAPLCFIALCTSNPGLAYCRLLSSVGKSGLLRRIKIPSAQEIAATVSDPDLGEIRVAAELLKAGSYHPILTPYLMQILAQPKTMPFREFAARPYASKDRGVISFFVPPIIRHRDGSGISSPRLPDLLGLSGDLSAAEQRRKNLSFVVHFIAMCGAAMAMANPADYYMQCPHTVCPYYGLRLCHAFAPVPPNYQTCGFPDTFEHTFNRPLSMVDVG